MALTELDKRRWPVSGPLLLAVAYFAADWLSQSFNFPAQLLATFYPPSALVVAALLLTPKRDWPAYVLATFFAQVAIALVGHQSLWLIPAFFVVNTARDLLTAGIVRRVSPEGEPIFGSLAGISTFTIMAFLSPALTAFAGAAIPLLTNSNYGYEDAWQRWFLSNTLSYLTITPAVVTLVERFRRFRGSPHDLLSSLLRYRAIEGTALFGGVALILLFALRSPGNAGEIPALAYLPLVFAVWAAVRFGPVGTSVTLLTIAATVTAYAMQLQTSLAGVASANSVLSLQLVVLSACIPMLFLAAIMEERSRALDRIRDSQSRVALATEAGRVFIYEVQAGTTEFHIDAGLARLLDLDPIELGTHEGWLSHVHEEDRGMFEPAPDYATGLTAAQQEFEFRMVDKGGATHWFVGRWVATRGSNGNHASYLGTITDVTERRQAQLAASSHREELAHFARLATLGELAASLAHEINQPLAAIRLDAAAGEMIIRSASPNLTQVAEILDRIVADDRRAADVISHLRALLRKAPSEQRILDARTLAQDVVKLLEHDALGKRVTLLLDVGSEPMPVLGDRVQLQQVILNLLLNAVDATRAEPNVYLRTPVYVRAKILADSRIEIAVVDGGPGIPADTIDRIFTSFFTTKPDGLGMGLPICRSIVEAHSGELWARNNPTSGATVGFTLPAAGPLDQMAGRRKRSRRALILSKISTPESGTDPASSSS